MANHLDNDLEAWNAAKVKGQKKKPAKESEPAYSQNPEFIGQAYAFYCKGMSLPNVATALKPEWPECNARTLQRIAKDNGWPAARAQFLALYAQAMSTVEGLLPEAILSLQRLRSQMEARGIVKAADVFAYKALLEDLLMYTGKHPKLKDSMPLAISEDAEIQALLEAIAEDDVVGNAWKRRRAHIERAWREKISAKTAGKTKTKKGGKNG